VSIDKVLITGSCGLVGSESVRYFSDLGCNVVGIDNNLRKTWFGDQGDTSKIKVQLRQLNNYRHITLDITDEHNIRETLKEEQPDLIIHAAAQPSHEKSSEIPFSDFKVNAFGTINLLEATRLHCSNAIFVFVSTNKVYGELSGVTAEVEEYFSIDQTLHTPFGASKASADLMVQEYGRYYGMNTVCFRCGCITGRNHRGVEQHGFLAYLCKCAKEKREYTIYGWEGKQIRDNIHAYDLVRAFHEFAKKPKPASVYNIGGGRENSVSLNRSIEIIKEITGLDVKTSKGHQRRGDHETYITCNDKFKGDYPNWQITRDLGSVFHELLA
jgi:CDP-paratose 2-epimerase